MIYKFRPSLNGLEALHHAPGLKRCDDCNIPLNWADAHWDMFTKPTSVQISTTIDGFTLASPAFKARYESEGWIGLTFRPLSSGYFDVRATRTVRLCQKIVYGHSSLHDAGIRCEETDPYKTAYRTDSCPTCGQYGRSWGGGSVTIARGEVPVAENEFVGGEIVFWSGDHFYVDLIVGQAVRDSHYQKRFARCSVYNKAFYQGWSTDVA